MSVDISRQYAVAAAMLLAALGLGLLALGVGRRLGPPARPSSENPPPEHDGHTGHMSGFPGGDLARVEDLLPGTRRASGEAPERIVAAALDAAGRAPLVAPGGPALQPGTIPLPGKQGGSSPASSPT